MTEEDDHDDHVALRERDDGYRGTAHYGSEQLENGTSNLTLSHELESE